MQPILIGLLTAVQLTGSLLVQFYLFRELGIGQDTDALVAAQVVPMVFNAILVAALQSVWLSRLSVCADRPQRFKLALGNAQGQALWMCLLVTVVAGGGTFLWIPLLFPVFSADQQALSALFTVVFLCGNAFSALSSVSTFAMRAKGRFLVPEVVGIVSTALALAFAAVALPAFGVWAGVWAIVLKSGLTCLLLMHHSHWPPIHGWRALRSRATWRRMRPVLGGALIYKASPLVDRHFASQALPGGLTLFNLAMMAMGSAAILMEKAIGATKGPTMARHVASGELREARAICRRGLLEMAVIAVVCLSMLVALRGPMSMAVSSALNVDAEAAGQLWLYLTVLVGYMFAAAAGTLPVSLFHAMRNTAAPTIVGSVGVIAGVFLKFLTFTHWGLIGLLLAVSIHYLVALLVMFLAVERSIHERLA